MLITALQWRDEFQALRTELPDRLATLRQQVTELRLDEIPPRLHAVAEAIWELPLAQMIPLHEVYGLLSVCELKIYQTIHELIRTGQIVLATPLSQKVA